MLKHRQWWMLGLALLPACTSTAPCGGDAGESGDAGPMSDTRLDAPRLSSDAPGPALDAFSSSDAGPPPAVPYGPTGTRWPSRTPRCESTPRATANNWGEVVAALRTANAGDVIHLNTGSYGAARLDDAAVLARAATWTANNVLVCAAPGAQPRFDSLRIEVPNTSWARLFIGATFNIEAGANHTRIAQSRLGAGMYMFIHSVDDTELVELALIERSLNGDRMQISSTRPGDPNPHDILIDGCWFEGTTVTLAGEHADNIQTLSVAGTVTIRNSYIGAAGNNASIQAGNEFQGSEPYAAYNFDTVFLGGAEVLGNGNVLGVGNPTRYRNCEFDINLRVRPESYAVSEMTGCRVEPGDAVFPDGRHARDLYPDNAWGVPVNVPVFVPPPWWW